MTRFKLPYDWVKPKIVIGYDGQIKLLIYTNANKLTKKQTKELQKLKIKYLSHKLGYKVEPLSKTIKHNDYEKLRGKKK